MHSHCCSEFAFSSSDHKVWYCHCAWSIHLHYQCRTWHLPISVLDRYYCFLGGTTTRPREIRCHLFRWFSQGNNYTNYYVMWYRWELLGFFKNQVRLSSYLSIWTGTNSGYNFVQFSEQRELAVWIYILKFFGPYSTGTVYNRMDTWLEHFISCEYQLKNFYFVWRREKKSDLIYTLNSCDW